MKNKVIGILAHVDAGKTTLAEAMLYRAGKLRSLGRVDRGDTALDTHALERARGITIFASEAAFRLGDTSFTMLDTPGHVDFSAETERTLQVLDAAILVISGTDGVQAHTRTLWRLLELYHIPALLFITKMDFARREREEILAELKAELSEGCIDYETGGEEFAVCKEALLEQYLEKGSLSDEAIAELMRERLAFPCFFGSGLKLDGVDRLLEKLPALVPDRAYPALFGGRVFKISRDERGERLTHIKVTGGSLQVRQALGEEKISAIRIYNGGKYETAETAEAGQICALCGLSATFGGQGLGYERAAAEPCLEPVLNYRLILPAGADPQAVLPKLRLLQEEDPQLRFSWDGFLQQIYVSLMGEVQTEILKSIIRDRFDLEIGIGESRVLYKETIEAMVEGIGHYEPLRHYAEVHLLLQPLPRGAGLQFESRISEDLLERNWQRLILMHLKEKQHLGVLTGSPITDLKISLGAGRAHLKHTEGGDFRQATYRAVRQGLMQAKSILLEPYYRFRIEVPAEQIGRAINDMRARHATFESPELAGELYLLEGRAPVTAMQDYAAELAAYSGGRGRISMAVEGYDLCHNTEEVLEKFGYSPEADTENTPDSVFCAHGAGFNVKWNEVADYMHLESCLKAERPQVNYRNLNISDKELEAIMLRTFGPIRRREYGIAKVETVAQPAVAAKAPAGKSLLIIDGYNVIFCWQDLKALAEQDLEAARSRLIELMSNFSAYKQLETIIVFDGYRVAGNSGEKGEQSGIRIAYTKENETADVFIEKLIAGIGKNDKVRVVTSDGLIQLTAVRKGVLRVAAKEFEAEVEDAFREMRALILEINQ